MDLIYSGVLYIVVWCISLMIIRRKYRFSMRYPQLPKLTVLSMFVISSLFTFYNYVITNMKPNLGSDRLNYSVEFSGVRSVGSIGLQAIFDLVKRFGGDIYTVFYITTFISISITLYGYKKSKLITPRVLGLLMISEWFFYTVTALKQSYANAIAVPFFVVLCEDEGKYKDIKCIVLALLASLFHTTGMILFVVYVLSKMKKAEKVEGLLYVILAVAVLLLNPLMEILSRILLGIIPMYAIKISSYLPKGRRAGGGFAWVVIKYIPFYFVAILGFINRKRIKYSIPNYDYYLVISVLSSGLLLYSARIYWFLRFVGIFIIPVYTYFFAINGSIYQRRTRLLNYMFMYVFAAFFFIRWFILIYSNYGGF